MRAVPANRPPRGRAAKPTAQAPSEATTPTAGGTSGNKTRWKAVAAGWTVSWRAATEALELLTFLPRPTLTGEEVVLPDGVLDAIEQHTVGIAAHGERLLAAGQHLKRGLLLHGLPGTGKTHTVRYLMGRLPSTTVIILSGTAMRSV